MPPTRSPTPLARSLAERIAFLIAALALLAAVATYHPQVFFAAAILGPALGYLRLVRPEGPGGSPRRRADRFRFSVGRMMVAAVALAGILALIRTLYFAFLTIPALRGPSGFSERSVLGLVSFFGILITLVYVGDTIGSMTRRLRRPVHGRNVGGETMFGLSRKERWAKIQGQPFPPEWSAILAKNVPIYGKLPEADQLELRGLVQVFLAEKIFEGCDGLTITDEIRVTIAAQACLLLLRRETDVYPKLITILVYPSAYVSNMPQHSSQGVVTAGPQGRLGEAWTSGVVVLSWDDVKLGASDVRDGHNVVFHEFAHQLDTEDGSSDGAPILPSRNLYSAWARVLGAEYEELRRAAETGKKSVLDTYGAGEPAEFFAVATEAFFEKPVQLKKKHPELYEELKTYYVQDPEADFVADRAARPEL